MNNLFEQFESMASELPLDKKKLLITQLNGQDQSKVVLMYM